MNILGAAHVLFSRTQRTSIRFFSCSGRDSIHGAQISPVIIAGGGPSGLVLGLQLAHYGVPSIVVERRKELTKHPQAHFINNRTMEVFRNLDGLADEVRSLSPPLEEWRRFVYCRSLAGPILGQVDHFKGHTDPCNPDVSPEPVAHVSQSRLLPLLMRRAKSRSGLMLVMMDHTVKSLQVSAGGIEVTVQDPRGQNLQLVGSYLAAADGYSSCIRSSLGISMQGEHAMQHLINIHFVSRAIGQLARQRPGMLYFVFNSEVVAVLVAHDMEKGEFVAQVPYFPPLQSPQDFSESVCLGLICAAAGLPNISDICVEQVRPWVMSAEVASRFCEHRRVFLLGDAAHCFPPAGGFGMNTGVQDAHNLAWKLAAVMQGNAGERLLDTYEVERRPVAKANAGLSIANWREAIKIPQALGLDPGMANVVSSIAASGLVPSSLGKPLLEGALSVGRSLAAANLGPAEAWRQAQLAAIFESGETLRLQFPREDLGFVYREGALVRESRPEIRQEGRESSCRSKLYIPSSAPGCRLPHSWLMDYGETLALQSTWPLVPGQGLPANPGVRTPKPLSQSEGGLCEKGVSKEEDGWVLTCSAGAGPEGVRISTLDLPCAPGKSKLLLLIDGCSGGEAFGCDEVPEGAWVQWTHAALQLASEERAPEIGIIVVRRPQLASASSAREEPKRRWPGPGQAAVVASVVRDEQGRWRDAVAASSDAGAAWYLVRPDGHVAVRFSTDSNPAVLTVLECFKHLSVACRQVLCLD